MNKTEYISPYEFSTFTLKKKLELTYCMTNFDYRLAFEVFVENPSKANVLSSQYPPVLDFDECNRGEFVSVGNFGGMPVNINIFWYRFNGKYFGFWEAISQVVNYDLIDKWFKDNYSGVNVDHSRTLTLHYILQARKETPQEKMNEALK